MNMFFIIGAAFAIGFILILVMTLSGQKKADGIGRLQEQELPSFKRFCRICSDLVEALKLEIDHVETDPDSQSVDIYARNPKPYIGGDFLIHAVLQNTNAVVSAAEIVELSNAIIQNRLSKGIFITTGRFTDELSAIGELAPLEFIDGKLLEELARRYRIPLLETK